MSVFFDAFHPRQRYIVGKQELDSKLHPGLWSNHFVPTRVGKDGRHRQDQLIWDRYLSFGSSKNKDLFDIRLMQALLK